MLPNLCTGFSLQILDHWFRNDFGAVIEMGNSQSSSTSSSSDSQSSSCPINKQEVKEGKCPVQHSNSTSSCPITKKNKVYNVYSEEIDPTNMMPANSNNVPSDGQKYPLNTSRVSSTIPKGGLEDGSSWTYPSEQMFYNAMVRKNKSEDVHEGHVPVIVAIHNNMNEKTWKLISENE